MESKYHRAHCQAVAQTKSFGASPRSSLFYRHHHLSQLTVFRDARNGAYGMGKGEGANDLAWNRVRAS